jgi:hypothetical protein
MLNIILPFCGFNVSIRFYLMVKNKHIIISLLSFVWNQKQNLIIIRFECKGNKISLRNDNFKIPNQYFYAASNKVSERQFHNKIRKKNYAVIVLWQPRNQNQVHKNKYFIKYSKGMKLLGNKLFSELNLNLLLCQIYT